MPLQYLLSILASCPPPLPRVIETVNHICGEARTNITRGLAKQWQAETNFTRVKYEEKR